jgi:hypothetical protein
MTGLPVLCYGDSGLRAQEATFPLSRAGEGDKVKPQMKADSSKDDQR